MNQYTNSQLLEDLFTFNTMYNYICREIPILQPNKIYKNLKKTEQKAYLNELLTDKSVDINRIFFDVILCGEPHEIYVFIKHGADINYVHPNTKNKEHTLLFSVAKGHNVDIFKKIISKFKNIDLNATCEDKTLAHYAFKATKTDTACFIIENKNFKINNKDIWELFYDKEKIAPNELSESLNFDKNWINLLVEEGKHFIKHYINNGFNIHEKDPYTNLSLIESINLYVEKKYLPGYEIFSPEKINQFIEELKIIQNKFSLNNQFKSNKTTKTIKM